MKSKRMNSVVIFLFLLSLIVPTVFATRSLAVEPADQVKLDTFEQLSQEQSQLTAAATMTLQPSDLPQQVQLELSANFQAEAADPSVIDTKTNEVLGTYSMEGQQLAFQLPELAEPTQVALQLTGTYQNDGNEVVLTQLETQEQRSFLPEQLPAEIEETAEVVPSSEPVEKEDSLTPAPRNTTVSLSAEIKEREIVDGTESFDGNNNPGNDDGPNNQIVRSFDTITYPLKMTINDPAGGTLNNIKVRITGTLHNGIVNGRTNAIFTDNSTHDFDNDTITYEDEYLIDSSGCAITYPIIVSVMGADQGVSLEPEFHIQVISVDGVDVSEEQIEASFTDIVPRTVSSKVSIAPRISSGTIKYASQTIVTTDAFDKNHRTIPLGVELMAVPLSGKTHIKGAAFPSSELRMTLSLTGRVVWDGSKEEQVLDFNDEDQAPYIVDYHNNVYGRGPIGISPNPNTWSNTANIEYNQAQFNDNRSYWAGSKMTDRENYNELNSIVDSGVYAIDNYDLTQEVTIDVKDYVIGDSFPIRRADGYTGRTIYSPNEKAFTNQTLGLLVPDEYAYQGRMNPQNLNNTLYYKAALTFVDRDGMETTDTTEFSMRNEIPGVKGSMSSIFKNPDTGLAFGKYDISNDIHPYGDGQAVSGAKVALSGGGSFGDSRSEGGYQYLQKWNNDAFQMLEDDFKANETTLSRKLVFGDLTEKIKEQGYWYGISKKTDPNTLENLKNATIKDYDWYTSSEITRDQLYQEVGAVLIDKNVPVARSWKYSAGTSRGVQLTIVTEKLGSSTVEGTPNIYVAEMAIFRDSDRKFFDPADPKASYNDPSRYSISEGYDVKQETKYDENNKIEKLQVPVNLHTKFDTIGIVPVKVSNDIKSGKPAYRSTDIAEWTIHENGLIASHNYKGEDEITWTVTLPPGLSYQYGSGKYGSETMEPTVVTNDDASQTLTWKVTVTSTAEETAVLKNIHFKTQFDDLNINYKNNIAELTVTSVISTAKDTSEDDLRTASATIDVTKVGRLGIYQTITPPVEEIDRDYQETITPYTSMKKEENVRGIVPLSKEGNYLNSHFTGNNQLKAIETELENNQTLEIYLNDELITEKNPNAVNVDENGWYPYTGAAQDLSEVQTVFYEFQQELNPNDTANIHLTMENDGNAYGNIYRHQAYGNSSTDYRTPIHSNISQHSVKGRKLSGIVWLDENKDGQMEKTEERIKNVSVALYKQENGAYVKVTENLRGQSLNKVKTDENGKYAFTYLGAGSYIVAFDSDAAPLADMEVTKFNIGDAATNSKVDLDGQLGDVDGWNTILSDDFPQLEQISEELFQQTNVHLGVYPKPIVPPPTSESSTEETTTPTTDTDTETTTPPSDTTDTTETTGTTETETEPPETSEPPESSVPPVSSEPADSSSEPPGSSDPPEETETTTPPTTESSTPEPSSEPPTPTDPPEPTEDTDSDTTPPSTGTPETDSTVPSSEPPRPSDPTETTDDTETDSSDSSTSTDTESTTSVTNSTTMPPTRTSSTSGSADSETRSSDSSSSGSDSTSQRPGAVPGNSSNQAGGGRPMDNTPASSSNEEPYSLMPATNDTKQNFIFIIGVCLLLIAGRLWYKQTKAE